MRRIRPAGFLPPFQDGARLDADLRPVADRHPARPQDLERLRDIRGTIVSLCIEIRNKLNALMIVEDYGGVEFREYDFMLGKRVDFVTSTLSIADKVDCSRGMIRFLFKKRADGVFYRLLEVNRLFQLLISRPFFTIESRGDADYEICVADEQFIWTIDEPQVKEWVALLRRCIADLDEAGEKVPLIGAESSDAGGWDELPLEASGR